MTRRKIIIDTDPGIDDAMAIFYALASPELDVIGLTTIFGNAATDLCTTNALRLLEIAERTDVPVARGAQNPLAMQYRGAADFVHGTDGQGDVFDPLPTSVCDPRTAAQFLIDTVMAAPGEVTLVPLGPLTNVALAMSLEPAFASSLAGMVLMGGNAFCSGNASPAAEANILNDPEAADVVFGADCPIVMCGLDITEQTVMTSSHLASLASIDNPRGRHLARIVPYYHRFYRDRTGLDGIFVHDSATISYLLDPTLFTTVSHPVRVDCSPGIGRGKTWPARRVADDESPWAGRRNVTICVGIDAEKSVALEFSRLSS
jgi:inosine-uridine nucleoside N-ribohydrolase